MAPPGPPFLRLTIIYKYIIEHTKNLEERRVSLLESEDPSSAESTSSEVGNGMDDVVFSCSSHYNQTFVGLVQQGSELEKRKLQNPYPKRDEIHQCIEIEIWTNKTNGYAKMFLMPWETIYSVDRAAFKISNQRLSRQRKIKQSESLVDMIKLCEVEDWQ